MRASLLGFLATAAIASAAGTIQCANDSLEDLVSRTSCGCAKKLEKCLRAADLVRHAAIQECFVANGCDEADADVSVSWFLKECNMRGQWRQEDLKRRQDDDNDNTDTTTEEKTKGGKSTAEATTTKEEKTTKEEPTTTTQDSTTAPSTAEATTTTEESTTSDTTTAQTTSTPTSTSTSPDSTLTTSTTTDSTSTPSATAASQTTPLTCSVTKMQTTSACASSGTTTTCTPTVKPSATCAPGMICFGQDKNGKDLCMKEDNHLTTSGLAVTILFAVSIFLAALAATISIYRGRAAAKRKEYAHAAITGGGAAAFNKGKARAGDVESSQHPYVQRDPSEAHLPLISPGGSRSDQPEYFEGPGSQRQAPKLHPGLGALGQN